MLDPKRSSCRGTPSPEPHERLSNSTLRMKILSKHRDRQEETTRLPSKIWRCKQQSGIEGGGPVPDVNGKRRGTETAGEA